MLPGTWIRSRRTIRGARFLPALQGFLVVFPFSLVLLLFFIIHTGFFMIHTSAPPDVWAHHSQK